MVDHTKGTLGRTNNTRFSIVAHDEINSGLSRLQVRVTTPSDIHVCMVCILSICVHPRYLEELKAVTPAITDPRPMTLPQTNSLCRNLLFPPLLALTLALALRPPGMRHRTLRSDTLRLINDLPCLLDRSLPFAQSAFEQLPFVRTESAGSGG
jgi:hypothetical protein